jgi:type VI secretion system protein ImpF
MKKLVSNSGRFGRDGGFPVLLDRLTQNWESDNPSRQSYLDILSRDLEWLLNCVAPSTSNELQNYHFVTKSVVNYGLRPFNGLVLGELDIAGAANHIRTVIETFEPRLVPGSVRVLVDENRRCQRGQLAFSISADCWHDPLPLHLAISASWDLETGLVGVERPRR